MNEKIIAKVHWSFWLISAISLIWNSMGVINFFMQMNPDVLLSYRESERAIIEARPVWATGGFMIAVFGGTFGSLLLVFKKSAAFYMFIISLLGVLVTTAYTLSTGISFSVSELLGIILMPLIVALFLIWYSTLAKNKTWIS